VKRSKRRPIPQHVTANLMKECRRRCCVCAILDADFSQKHLQVAHLDHDPSNNHADNLAALCLQHHDEYDTKRSQSKGFSKTEVSLYKRELALIWQKKDQTIAISLGISDQKTFDHVNAKLLGEVLEVFDTELANLEQRRTSNGQRLLHLGKTAVDVYGDFTTGVEAMVPSKSRRWGRLWNMQSMTTGKRVPTSSDLSTLKAVATAAS
jgi:hypothetical protein